MSPTGWSAEGGGDELVRPARRRWRLVSTRGRLVTEVCGLCGALVVVEGRDKHDLSHRAERQDRA